MELRFLIVELRYLGVDWDCLKISYDFKENLKIDFHQGCNVNIDVTSTYMLQKKKVPNKGTKHHFRTHNLGVGYNTSPLKIGRIART